MGDGDERLCRNIQISYVAPTTFVNYRPRTLHTYIFVQVQQSETCFGPTFFNLANDVPHFSPPVQSSLSHPQVKMTILL